MRHHDLTISNCSIYFDRGTAAELPSDEMLMRIAALLIRERYPDAEVVEGRSFRISGSAASARGLVLTEERDH